jgi:hypothetical protein
MRLTEEELIRELRDERPEVDPEFGRRLDEWAAAGFPRRKGPGPGRREISSRIAGGIEGVRERFAATPPRRLIAPVGAAAMLFVVAGIAISQSGGPQESLTIADPQQVEDPATTIAPPEDTGAASDGTEDAAPSARSEEPAGGFESAGGGETGGDVVEQRQNGRAEIARDAQLVLSADADEVQEVADGVNDVVNRYRGFVVRSDVRTGDDTLAPGATFRLRIPAADLQPALADLSELAHVDSRNQGTQDITGRVVSAENKIERLEDALAAAERKLADAEGGERRELKQQIDSLEAQLDAEQRSLAEAEQRVDLVPVDVQIVTGSGDGEWGISEALEDAGDVLSAIGGGILVAGAVLVPLALVVGIAYAIRRRSVSRARDRALD